MSRFILLLISSLASFCLVAQVRAAERAPWCTVSRGAPSGDWIRLTDFALVPVDSGERQGAMLRLANRTIVPISPRTAGRLTRSAHPGRAGNLFLVRAGLIMSPGTSLERISAWFSTPDLLQVHWSERLGAMSVITLTSVAGSTSYYDVPLVLRASVRPRYVHVSCISAD